MDDGYVYFAQRICDGAVKVGFSADPEKRMKSLQTAAGDIELIGYTGGGRWNEKRLHRRYAPWRISGEWFMPDETLWRDIAAQLGLDHEALDRLSSRVVLDAAGGRPIHW
jgi:hypothetical protein